MKAPGGVRLAVAAMLAALRPGWARAVLLGACIVLQPVWIWFCWHVNGADWTVP